ncbi:hypothetical protein PAA8504_03945 [Palleronia abyssalis]|uniref:Uncharacterized protein n=1 Tax=Palleronia abyssalis TaxID=1501240 RepID=A0A2R8C148_9RHOB|nr:hypothetical protein PAA8504_03945 [Palleronia abyssalis]
MGSRTYLLPMRLPGDGRDLVSAFPHHADVVLAHQTTYLATLMVCSATTAGQWMADVETKFR